MFQNSVVLHNFDGRWKLCWFVFVFFCIFWILFLSFVWILKHLFISFKEFKISIPPMSHSHLLSTKRIIYTFDWSSRNSLMWGIFRSILTSFPPITNSNASKIPLSMLVSLSVQTVTLNPFLFLFFETIFWMFDIGLTSFLKRPFNGLSDIFRHQHNTMICHNTGNTKLYFFPCSISKTKATTTGYHVINLSFDTHNCRFNTVWNTQWQMQANKVAVLH